MNDKKQGGTKVRNKYLTGYCRSWLLCTEKQFFSTMFEGFFLARIARPFSHDQSCASTFDPKTFKVLTTSPLRDIHISGARD